jgi:hypothetical protein
MKKPAHGDRIKGLLNKKEGRKIKKTRSKGCAVCEEVMRP